MANHKGGTGRGKKTSNVKQPLKQPIPIDSGSSSSQTASSTSIDPSNTPRTQAYPVIEEEIRLRAYALYEERGRQDGLDHDDWSRAETEILAKYGKKEKSA